MTKPENSSIRRSKVGEQRTNRQTLIMNEGRSGGRSEHIFEDALELDDARTPKARQHHDKRPAEAGL